ncbi:MAG: hypothetical protein WAL71_08555 [Terriglobales bacterium]|jgi:hypothetical protein
MISDPKLPFPTEPAAVETSVNGESEPTLGNESSQSGRRAEPRRRLSTLRLWLRRAGVLFFVFLCATLGVMLMIVPWRPEWSENSLLLAYPGIRELISSGFVRGAVTGLGLLNVWIGFWEAIQYREDE